MTDVRRPHRVSRFERVRRALLMIAAIAAVWSAAISLTGGVILQLGPIRLSSRAPFNPLIIALLGVTLAALLAPPRQRERTLAADGAWLAGLVPGRVRERWDRVTVAIGRVLRGRRADSTVLVAVLLAAFVIVLGLVKAPLVASGSDPYGYVSHARQWASGTLRMNEPLMIELSDSIPAHAFAPLGYRVAPDGTALVPTYSPGFPMVMAVFERLGGSQAVFWVVPLLGAVAVLATYSLGRSVGGPSVGVSAAILMIASPAFLSQLTSAPMSDIPAMAWCALMLALLPAESRRAAFGAGLAAGAAVLTRPNIVPLVAIPSILLVWRALQQRMSSDTVSRVLFFAVGPMMACLTLALLYAYWYGSALESGYGSLTYYFQWAYLWPNAANYTRWIVETQTPLVALAIVVPLLATARRWVQRASILDGSNGRRSCGRVEFVSGRSRPPARSSCGQEILPASEAEPLPTCSPARGGASLSLLWAFAAVLVACYAFYLPFDDWRYLRFLLPALPAVLVLTAVGVFSLAARMRDGRTLVPIVMVAATALHGLAYMRNHQAFGPGTEWRYAIVGNYIAEQLPDRAVLLAMQHSGSARYYSGRTTIRYDSLAPSDLDATLEALRQHGYHPYFLLDEWEEPVFRAHYESAGRLGALDWPPLAITEHGGVRIYDPAHASVAASARPPTDRVR